MIGITYGKIEFGDLNVISTKVTMALHDSNSGNFANPASVMSFNSNNALTIRDPKTDFFKTIDEIIKSVENYIDYPDSTVGDKRSMGIQNSIAMMDDILDHTYSSHSKVGSNSNALTSATKKAVIPCLLVPCKQGHEELLTVVALLLNYYTPAGVLIKS